MGNAVINPRYDCGAYRIHTIEKVGQQLLDWIYEDEKNYSLSKFAMKVGIPRQRFSEWAKRSEKFKYAYDMAKQKQENYIVDGALHQRLSANFAALMCKNFHGWVDKHETTVRQEPVFQNLGDQKVDKMMKRVENNVEQPEIVHTEDISDSNT